MKPNILGISWLNGNLSAAVSHRNGRPVEWRCPYRVETENELPQALSASIRETGFRGKDVSLVVHTSRLVHQLTKIPPLEGARRNRFLERKALLLNPLGEPAAWSCQPALGVGEGKSVLFHYLPGSFYEAIVQACRHSGLRCRHVLSPLAVLQGQLLQLSPGAGETILLIAETEGTLTLLAGRGDGQVLFGRSLRYPDGAGGGRLGQELSRCAAYAQQRFGTKKINRACWIGSVEGFERLKPFAPSSLSFVPLRGAHFSWAKETIGISSLRLNKDIGIRLHRNGRKAGMSRTRRLGLIPVVLLVIALFIGLKGRQQEEATIVPALPQQAQVTHEPPSEPHAPREPSEPHALPKTSWSLGAIWRQKESRWAVIDGELVTENDAFGSGTIDRIEEDGVWLRTPIDHVWIGF